MKQNKLTIKIKKPVNEVFDFTINPQNTPKWIENIEVEETSEWPLTLGTIYRNKNNRGEWSEYKVVSLEPNKLFELVSSDKNYNVRYSYFPVDENESELEYFEWVDNGQLENPFGQEVLDKLKKELEV